MDAYEEICKIWRSWNVTTAEDISSRLHDSYVKGIRESNAIDSSVTSTALARDIIVFGTVTQYTGSLLVLTELSNASLCHKLLCKRFEERAPLTLDLVKDVHLTMMAGCYNKRRYIYLEERPGSFKRNDFVVGRTEVGSDPEDVERDMAELLCEMRSFTALDSFSGKTLTAAAYFHGAFETIHPFADGNGRVGRLLMNYWLALNNHPPITIFHENRAEYFLALSVYQEKDMLHELVNFLRIQTIKTWEHLIK